MLVSCSWDNVIKLWDVEARQELLTLQTTLTRLASVVISPDRSVVALGVNKSWWGWDDVSVLFAPSFSEIDARLKSKEQASVSVAKESQKDTTP